MPRVPLSTETKIGIPLAVVGALVVWVLTEVKDLGQRIAKIEGRLEATVAHVPTPPLPSLPTYPVDIATAFPSPRGRQP